MIEILDDLDEQLIGIYLEHNRSQVNSNYELSETLFAINEPFYMRTEKEALISNRDSVKRKKRLLNKKNIYEELFTTSQKLLIKKVVDKVRHTIKQLEINISDNSSAQQIADIALKQNNLNQYSDTLLCNANHMSVISGEFIIPPKSSFICSDVIHGLKVMQKHYDEGKFKVSDHFNIVLDPPWSTNKSVKRKRCYKTDDNHNILQMCQQLNLLIKSLPQQTNIRIAIWATHKEKQFVLDHILSILNLQCTHIFIWHKITRSGQSVKLRGGLEYLILASRKPSSTQCLNGILISIPSAIHSHKPPLQQLFERLDSKSCHGIVKNKLITPVVPIETTNDKQESTKSELLSHSINSNINGLELYARYLNVGFHSIGFECLKLQHCKLYNML